MNSRFLLSLSFAALLCGGCAKEEPRYELVRTEKGVIRLDKKSGEMVVLVGTSATFVDLEAARMDAVGDALLSKVKVLPTFGFPGAGRDLKMTLQYRWVRGRMDYRVTVAPYVDELNGLIRDAGNRLILIFSDHDGFEVTRVDAPLATMVRMMGTSKTPESWEGEGWLEISRADYQRIVNLSYTWWYSDTLKKALEK